MSDSRRSRRAAARDSRPAPPARRRRWPVVFAGLVVLAGGSWLAWAVWLRPDVVRDGAPSWSPDGKQIVFYSERGGRPADLFVMNADGANVRQLTRSAAAEGYPSWSPDGRQIAFEADDPSGNFDVYVMNADGTNVRRLTTDPKRDVAPAWSPNGAKIVFMSDRAGPEFDLFQMNADGSGAAPLTYGDTNWFPQYSPDGTRIAFHLGRDVHVMDVGTREVHRLTTDPANGMYPSWSPDGRQIVFMSWRNGRTELFTMNADGSDQQLLLSMPQGSAIDPRWSPDGSRVVFVATPETTPNPDAPETLERAIYTIDLATKRVTRLSR